MEGYLREFLHGEHVDNVHVRVERVRGLSMRLLLPVILSVDIWAGESGERTLVSMKMLVVYII